MKKLLWAVILLFFVCPCFFGSSKDHLARECWWEIFIELTSKGTYTLEEANASYYGNYAYAIQWSGCMEQDGEDFILYHEDSDLVRWTTAEKKKLPGIKETKIKKKFSEKPGFAFNYILTKKNNIHFDFLVSGFRVPQGGARKKILSSPSGFEGEFIPSEGYRL